jgi:hypothetical protein
MIGHGRVIGQGLVGLAQELQGRVLVAQAVLAGVSSPGSLRPRIYQFHSLFSRKRPFFRP